MKARLMLLAVMAVCAAEPSSGQDCRPSDTPPGVRVADRPGCKPSSPVSRAKAQRTGSQPGFVDLGNGTEVRVSGRVRMETRTGR